MKGFLGACVTAARPGHWIKGVIILIVPVYAWQFSAPVLASTGLVFLAFGLLSSAVYLLNDVVDADQDRRHPLKRQRPVASGALSIPQALGAACLLGSAALVLALGVAPSVALFLGLYAVLQVAYTFWLKTIALVEAIAVAIGFLLRAGAGAAGARIHLSSWFILCAGLLALMMVLEKRRAELALCPDGGSRAVLRHYSQVGLQRMGTVLTAGVLFSYALWSSGPAANGARTAWMMVTVPFVVYGLFRYQGLDDATRPGGEAGPRLKERPEEVLFRDRPLRVNLLLWLATTLAVSALHHRGLLP